MKWRKVLVFIIVFTLLIFASVIIIRSVYLNSQITFKRILGFKLPDSVSIINYSYNEYLFSDSYFYFKIGCSENDCNNIENEIVKRSQESGLSKMTQKDSIPRFKNSCSWWDLNEDDILVGYCAVDSGMVVKTKFLYIFFVKDKQGQYFTYIAN